MKDLDELMKSRAPELWIGILKINPDYNEEDELCVPLPYEVLRFKQ